MISLAINGILILYIAGNLGFDESEFAIEHWYTDWLTGELITFDESLSILPTCIVWPHTANR